MSVIRSIGSDCDAARQAGTPVPVVEEEVKPPPAASLPPDVASPSSAAPPGRRGHPPERRVHAFEIWMAARRAGRPITLGDIARAVGVHQTTISRWAAQDRWHERDEGPAPATPDQRLRRQAEQALELAITVLTRILRGRLSPADRVRAARAVGELAHRMGLLTAAEPTPWSVPRFQDELEELPETSDEEREVES